MSNKIVEQCEGCSHVTENQECNAYPNPSIFWRFGRNCALASHIKLIKEEEKGNKVRVGQQKTKKKTKGK